MPSFVTLKEIALESWDQISPQRKPKDNYTQILQGPKWQPTPVFLPGESQGQQSLVGCRLWGGTESETTKWLSSSSSSSSSNGTYADFSARLRVTISYNVVGEEATVQLEHLLTYETENQEFQRAITPMHETRNVIDYLKACSRLGSKTQKMQMLREAMAAAFKRKMKDILFVGIRSF